MAQKRAVPNWAGVSDQGCFHLSVIGTPTLLPSLRTVKWILYLEHNLPAPGSHSQSPLPPWRIPVSTYGRFLWEVFQDWRLGQAAFCSLPWARMALCSFPLQFPGVSPSAPGSGRAGRGLSCWLCVCQACPGPGWAQWHFPKQMKERFCKCVQFMLRTR